MIKAHLDLTRNNLLLGTLTWHQVDETGKMLDVGFVFTEDADDEIRARITEVCARPLTVPAGKVFPGSSKHFEALPKYLERLGCRVHAYY